MMHHSIRQEDWIRQEVISCQKQSYNQRENFVGSEGGSIVARTMSNRMDNSGIPQKLCLSPQSGIPADAKF